MKMPTKKQATMPMPWKSSKGFPAMGHNPSAKGKSANKKATSPGYPTRRGSLT